MKNDAILSIEEMESPAEKMLAAALYYGQCGFKVIPLKPGQKAMAGKRTGINYYSGSSNPKTLKNWFGSKGKFKNYNIGLVCGENLFAVDVDNVDAWNTVVPEGWEPEGPVQRTPSGGLHYLFKWQDNAKSSTNKIARGVDTRGGDGTPKSHIVAWPSVVAEGEYRWERFGSRLPGIPEWITEAMGMSREWSRGPGRGSEDVTMEDLEEEISIARLRKLLSRIDLDARDAENNWVISYDDWLHIGMAIHTQYPNQDGYDIFLDWSKTGSRHDPMDVEKRWDGFKDSGAVRIGTLIHHAQRFDMMDSAENPEAGDIIDELNSIYAVVQMGGSVKILAQKEANPHAPWEPDYELMDKRSFTTLMENRKVTLETMAKTVVKPASEVWLGSEKRRTLKGVNFFPGEKREVNGYFNIWSGWSTEPKQGNWEPFQEYILEIVANGNQDHYKWILDWLADLYQEPHDPKGVALVMSGIEGCGKGTFANTIGHTFYRHYRHLFNEEHLVGRFNSHLMGSSLIFADEVLYGGNKKAASTLKGLVTERYIMGEKKGVDTVPVFNCARVMIASNERWFIPAGAQARRWFCLKFSDKRANDYTYFNRLIKFMDDGGSAAMMYDLMNRTITSNLRYAPETELLMDQKARSAYNESHLIRWWIAKVDSGILGIEDAMGDTNEMWPEYIYKSDLIEDYKRFEEGAKFPVSPAVIYKEVQRYGLEKVRKRIDGKAEYLYKVPPLDEALAILAKDHGTDLREEK